jgi:hypothetical protein
MWSLQRGQVHPSISAFIVSLLFSKFVCVASNIAIWANGSFMIFGAAFLFWIVLY